MRNPSSPIGASVIVPLMSYKKGAPLLYHFTTELDSFISGVVITRFVLR